MLLEVAENPIVTGKGEPTVGDLRQAAEICSRPANAKRGWLCELRSAWLDWRASKLDILAELEAFSVYLADFGTGPETWEGNGRAMKSPWVVSTVAKLMHWLHITEDQAWAMPPGRANWLLACAMESSPFGGVDLISEEEEAMIAKLEEEERAG
jgi:hypothetical protein